MNRLFLCCILILTGGLTAGCTTRSGAKINIVPPLAVAITKTNGFESILYTQTTTYGIGLTRQGHSRFIIGYSKIELLEINLAATNFTKIK